MPMHTYSYADWRAAIDERLLQEADDWVSARKLSSDPKRLTKEVAMQKLSMLFPYADQLLADAVRDHIIYYSHLANEEAGFDLGITPHDMLVSKPLGYVILFATVDIAACKRMKAIDGVAGRLHARSEHRTALFGPAPRDKTEQLMDLLAAALPETDRSIGKAAPRYIVDCAVKGRITAQAFFEQTLGFYAPGAGARPH